MMVLFEELLWKLFWVVVNENVLDDFYKNFFLLDVWEVEGME